MVDSDPDATGLVTIVPESADYIFSRKVFIGVATCSRKELRQIISQLELKYTCGEYNIFSNNCNHFSD